MSRTRRVAGAFLGGVTAVALAATSAYAVPPANPGHGSVAGHGSTSAFAVPRAGDVALPDSVPGWASARQAVTAPSAGQTVSFDVLLPWQNAQRAEQLAMAVSTPGNPAYGNYLSEQQFNAKFAPSQADTDAVVAWLKQSGFSSVKVADSGLYVHAKGSVATVEQTFSTQLKTFSVQGMSLRAPASPLRVPASVRSSIAGVVGVDQSGQLIRPNHVKADMPKADAARHAGPDIAAQPNANTDSCSEFWGQNQNKALPQKLNHQPTLLCDGYTWRQARKTMNYRPKYTGKGQTVGVVLAYNYKQARADTSRTASQMNVRPLRPAKYDARLNKPFTRKDDCGASGWHGEQALDIQSVHAMAPAANIIYYGASNCATIGKALMKAVNQGDASVLTNSYGFTGELKPSNSQFKRFHRAMRKAALKGITVLFSSGDSGDNKAVSGTKSVNYPASDRFATAVGGISAGLGKNNQVVFRTGWQYQTYAQNNNTWRQVPTSEVLGPKGIGAGGGTSKYFAKPGWQSFLKGSKRHVPDIAGLADPYTGMKVGMTQDGSFEIVAYGGTSLASPLVAGMVAGLEQARGQRVGFLNPMLYSLRDTNAIQDVRHRSVGWTALLQGGGHILAQMDGKPGSLRANKGWDNVTGLGIPGPGFYAKVGKSMASHGPTSPRSFG